MEQKLNIDGCVLPSVRGWREDFYSAVSFFFCVATAMSLVMKPLAPAAATSLTDLDFTLKQFWLDLHPAKVQTEKMPKRFLATKDFLIQFMKMIFIPGDYGRCV